WGGLRAWRWRHERAGDPGGKSGEDVPDRGAGGAVPDVSGHGGAERGGSGAAGEELVWWRERGGAEVRDDLGAEGRLV
ncbi:MAG: hypothetical protein ACPL7O_09585, partial [Armatimonadota bacterium]